MAAAKVILSGDSATYRGFQGGAKGKKGSILDLNKYLDKQIRIKFTGGREGRVFYCCAHQ